MTKKLLHKTSRAYLIFAVLILVVSAPVFYYITEELYIEDADEALGLHKEEFLKYWGPKLKEAEIPAWNKFNRDIKITKGIANKSDTLFYTFYYDTLHKENEPYRELNAAVFIENKPYTLSARINLVESEDLMESIATLFLILLSILLLGIFLITWKLSIKLWKPFYETLHQIEDFEIDKNKQPQFAETDIEEFNRLNQSIGKLVQKNTAIYKNQREFVENAAHELQTPLAVFQATIDTFIQRADVTNEQAEILTSLNNGVSRLNHLNKNLLLLSKIENETYGSKEPVLLNEYFEKHLEFFTEQAKAKNLTIQVELMQTVEVKSNPVLAEILINNLFLNAIRHNCMDGQISVTLSQRSLVFSNTGQASSLVADKLFNRFSKTNPSEQGTGLGLSIVKKIADLNGWKISYSFSQNLHTFSVSF